MPIRLRPTFSEGRRPEPFVMPKRCELLKPGIRVRSEWDQLKYAVAWHENANEYLYRTRNCIPGIVTRYHSTFETCWCDYSQMLRDFFDRIEASESSCPKRRERNENGLSDLWASIQEQVGRTLSRLLLVVEQIQPAVRE